MHPERQAPEYLVDEQPGRPLVACVVDLQDANSGAVVDGRELIQAAPGPRDPLKELHVQLQAVTGLRFLIALPALTVPLVLLIRREPRHAMPRQDAVYRGTCDGNLMEAMQVRGDPARSEMIVLAQVENFADDLTSRGAGRMLRRARTVAEAGVTVLGVPFPPFIERFTGNPEVTAHAGDVSIIARSPQEPQSPGC